VPDRGETSRATVLLGASRAKTPGRLTQDCLPVLWTLRKLRVEAGTRSTAGLGGSLRERGALGVRAQRVQLNKVF
jgi:hypothetical protein